MKTIHVLLSIILLWGCVGCAPAEHPEAKAAAVDAANTWLSLIDSGAFDTSWDASAAFFKEAVPKDKWIESLTTVRKPLGANLSRNVKSAKFTTSLKGAPKGEYVVIQYKSTFSKEKKVIETVTPMKDKDGIWRVSGYYLKAGRRHWLTEMMDD